MIKKIILGSLIGLSCPLAGFSGTMADVSPLSSLPFYVGAQGGYGTMSGGYKQDGNSALGRLSFGVHAKEYKNVLFGAEVGVQSGNDLRLAASSSVIDASGGLPVQATSKPFIDLLATIKMDVPNKPIFVLLKGGVAFRQLQLEGRTSSSDSLSKANGEFQGGLGWQMTKNVAFLAMYQGIYSTNNAGVRLNSVSDTTISNIPTQQAGLLGIEYTF